MGKYLVVCLMMVFSSLSGAEAENPIKGLEWLIGTWEDSNDDVKVSSTYSWDEGNQFIINKFDVEVKGQKPLKGTQFLGWDPDKRQIRAWTFDTDGGFGEGVWHNKGNQWISETKFTLPDGRIGTSVNVFTKVNDSTFTFESTEKEVAGEILPNSPVVKITKKSAR